MQKKQKYKFENGNLYFKDNSYKKVTAKLNLDCLTYAKETNTTIEIYNIKAVSSLGKTWLLKTLNDGKDGKFEIVSDFIKGKVKK